MNLSSVDTSEVPNPDPPVVPEKAPEEPPVEIAAQEAAQIVASTPKTLPLKRAAEPLFVPATLPEETQEAVAEVSAPSEISAAPEVSASPEVAAAPPEVSATPTVAPAPEIEAAPELVENPPQPKPEATFPTVTFSQPADSTHNASLTLELRCEAPQASIFYALDAQDVDESGLLYNPAERIFLTASKTVAARAFINEQSGPLALARFEIIQPGWQKIEPLDQSDATTHEALDDATLEGAWRLAAASVRGKLHAHRGGWREDAFRHGMAHAGDGTYSIVVVSDGAGSAPLSRVGSNLICQVALDFLRTELEKHAALSSDSKTLVERDLPLLRALLVESARLALEKLRAEASGRGKALGEFAATLLIFVRREWNDQQLCGALQAGDGGIALWNEDNTLTILGAADHGEQSGETRFITSNNMENELAGRVKFSIRPNLRAVAVMTDGVADDFFPEPERFPELFGIVLPLVETQTDLSPGTALLDWIDYEKKGSADDRALVVCWRASSSSNGEGNDGDR